MSSKFRLGSLFVFLILAIGLSLTGTYFLGDSEIQALRAAIASLGWAAPLAFVTLYVAGTLVGLPGTLLTLPAPLLFGPYWAFVWVVLGSNLGAIAAFALTRRWGRDMVLKLLPPKWRERTLAIEGNGLRFVLLARLAPFVPFNALNFLCGLSGLRWRDYIVGTFLGMLPGTYVYICLGGLLEKGQGFWTAETGSRPGVWVPFVLALLLALLPLFVRLPSKGDTFDSQVSRKENDLK